MLRRRGRSREDARRVSELHERRQELVKQLVVTERFAAELDSLSNFHCAALAAAAAERLLPVYRRFRKEEGWGDYEFLRTGLDSVWNALAGRQSVADLRAPSVHDESRTVPDLGGDERWKSEWVAEAQDAAISVLTAMDAVANDDRESALHALQHEIDAVENYIAQRDALPYTRPPAEGDTLVQALEQQVEREETTIGHPLVRETLEIIENDLETVRSTGTIAADVVGALKASAEQQSLTARLERS
jgi:uncharacterized protein YjaG (DUF416 family)